MTLDVRFVANNPAAVVGTYPWINYVLDVFKKNGYKMTMGEVPITSMAIGFTVKDIYWKINVVLICYSNEMNATG